MFNLGEGDTQKAYARTDLGPALLGGQAVVRRRLRAEREDGRVKTNAPNSFGTWQSQYMPPRTFGVNMGYAF